MHIKMKLRRAASLCITFLLSLWISGAVAQEPILLGAANVGRNDISDLYQIRPTTGEATLIGPIGFERVGAMAFDDVSGRLLATGERPDGTDIMVLIEIDPRTGAGTEIGPTGIEPVGGQFTLLLDMDFRGSDNMLFGFSQFSPLSDSLVELDTVTGAATLLGGTNPRVFGAGNGLAFSPDDSLFFAPATDFFLIDESPGRESVCVSNLMGCGALNTLDDVTVMRTVKTRLFYPSASFGIVDEVNRPARVNAMDFHPDSGILFGSVVVGFGPVGGGGRQNFLTIIDTTRGGVSQIGPTVDGLDALAWVRPGIGGSVTGISPTRVRVVCLNTTIGGAIVFELPPDFTSWDCEAEGLVVIPGDEIKMNIKVGGIADGS